MTSTRESLSRKRTFLAGFAVLLASCVGLFLLTMFRSQPASDDSEKLPLAGSDSGATDAVMRSAADEGFGTQSEGRTLSTRAEESPYPPKAEAKAWSAVVHGRVVDPWGGSRGEVLIEIEDGEEPFRMEFIAGGQGEFEGFVTGTGRARIRVVEAGTPLSSRCDISYKISRAQIPERPGYVPRVNLGVILISDSHRLTVRVRDDDGNAVDGADIWVWPRGQGRGRRDAGPGIIDMGSGVLRGRIPDRVGRTDPDGTCRVEVSGVACGGSLIAVGADGVGKTVLGQDGPLRDGQEVFITVTGWQPYEFVVQRFGKPVQGATVRIGANNHDVSAVLGWVQKSGSHGAPANCSSAKTDADGRAELLSLPYAESLRVTARLGDDGCSVRLEERGPQLIHLPSAWTGQGEEIRFVDEYSRPVDGVHAEISGQTLPRTGLGTCRVSRGGQFRLPLRLTAECEGYYSVRKAIDLTGILEIEVKLQQVEPLTVNVIDGAATPLVGAGVAIELGDEGLFPPRREALTDNRGQVVFDNTPTSGKRLLLLLPPEPASEWSYPPERIRLGSAALHYPLGDGELERTLVLERSKVATSSLFVRAVAYETGRALAIERVEFTKQGESNPPTGPPSGILLGNDGAHIDCIGSGTYLIWVQAVGGQVGVVRTEVPVVGEMAECVVSDSIRMNGLVSTTSDAVSLDRVLVTARMIDLELDRMSPTKKVWPPLVVARCDGTGAFALEGLMPIPYEVTITRPFTTTKVSTIIDPVTDESDLIELTWK